MPNDELLELTITELAPKIRVKDVSPVEVTEGALARADGLPPKLSSFITLLHDQAMSAAKEQEAALAFMGPSVVIHALYSVVYHAPIALQSD